MRTFGQTTKGEATLYEIVGVNGLRAEITNYGATLVSLYVKDKNGIERDVVTGYDTAEEYERESCYFGATVGRSANRIANAKCILNGEEVQLEVNDNVNNLHSGANGLAERLWDVKEQNSNSITFTIMDEAFSDGFPGNLQMDVTYSISEENVLSIHYHGISDADTVCNFTNHSYFNLNGHENGDILNHKLQMNCPAYTPVLSSEAIPTGEEATVVGTPLDFTQPKEVGKEIAADFEQLKFVNGYDHNFVIDQSKDYVAKLYADKSGIVMVMKTDLPGVQLYTGNWIGGQKGKGGANYVARGALCLESQYFPNAINEPNFQSSLLKKGEVYDTVTSYGFYTE